MITFVRLKWASTAHSIVYACLLVCWLVPGWHTGEMVFGFAHGIGWILMCVLVIIGLKRRVIPLYLAVCVAVIGAVGPFVGSAGFFHEQRARVQDSWP